MLHDSIVRVCRRERYIKGRSIDFLAKKYGVAREEMSKALRGRTHSHIQDPPQVIAGRRNMKGCRSPLRPEDRGDVLRMRMQDRMTIAEIAQRYRASRVAVRKMIGDRDCELSIRGERATNTRLSPKMVVEMRMKHYVDGIPALHIAKQHGLNYGTVRRMLRGETYQHVPMPDN